eukprot:CAMPEP_0172544794 /NCGR_PEP_ID=MMETSP1067-20121228/14864_1 /TAXON_ID=265564 ORGANISM="Thalassiosira punctigera, Strain Tpunct2005C2" /NCGR_SAMPLE_ID=MMETSP1067 /ASSEMBLY_ACC=CAM_ASM_000444 /LENGTH=485 /DNA_ID=CAMNT_0013331415 /DNA_START=1 /DNA_END=1459 /DNA_ORIENTATION=+
MGAINSHFLHKRLKDEGNDATPVMGDGYCPLYDAALVGDWERLVALCEEGAKVADGGVKISEENEDGGVNGSAGSKQEASNGHRDDDVIQTPDKDVNAISSEKVSKAKDESQQQKQQQPFTLFVDAKGNTPLHLACRRDPPLRAVRALLRLHPPMAWRTTHDRWLPLHLACHCGCDVEVANALLDAMETEEKGGSLQGEGELQQEQQQQQQQRNNNDIADRLLPRDVWGRTPLHLACASSRDPRRRPDLVRLLLLRIEDPRAAALTRDWVDCDHRMGVDLALGDLQVLSGIGWMEANGAENAASNGISPARTQPTPAASSSRGRTPLDLIEDDYREELEEALLPGFSITNAIATCRGEEVEKDAGSLLTENLDAMYECWAMLSVLILAAGTPGTADQVKQALGGRTGDDETATQQDALLGSFSKPCHDVVQDFQAIHHACQASADACPPQFRELAKKFLQGQVDKRSMGKFSAYGSSGNHEGIQA